MTNKLYVINRPFNFCRLFYIKGTKCLTFRQYITNSFNGNAKDVSSREPPALRGAVNFGYHESKTGKIIVKVISGN